MIRIEGNDISNCETGIHIGNKETNINIQSFDQIINKIEKDSSLDLNEKTNLKSIITNLKDLWINAEPYARPYILQTLQALIQHASYS